MREYLTKLITEKGRSLDDNIGLDGHYGLTWKMLVDFIVSQKEHHFKVRQTLVSIDFQNGDVFDFLKFCAQAMVKHMGLDVYTPSL